LPYAFSSLLHMGFVSRLFLFGICCGVAYTGVILSQEHKMVLIAHVTLSLFAALRVPASVCRMIIPGTPPGHWNGVKSSDHVVAVTSSNSSNSSIRFREYVPDKEHNSSSAFVWAHGKKETKRKRKKKVVCVF